MLSFDPSFLAFLVLLAAIMVDAVMGWPAWLFRCIGHPVTWMGRLIGWLDQHWNGPTMPQSRRRFNGMLALVVLIGAVGAVAWAVQASLLALLPPWAALPLIVVCMASLIAQKSLYQHVAAVAEGLERGGLVEGRRAVSMIVGRNPLSLDEAGVGRAAVESLAENFSDGIVAPIFWAAVGGLPGIALYKAINTADSMIGHRTPRHEAFGWASARLDDWVNLPASRLSALWLLLAAGWSRAGWRAVWRDAPHHRSPNAGWPEAAMAGVLGLALGGPRVYGDMRVDDMWMGNGRAVVTAGDIRKALRLYGRACGLQAVAVMVLAAIAF